MSVNVTMPLLCNDDIPVYEMSAASGADPAPLSHSFAPIPKFDYLQLRSLHLLRTGPLEMVELSQYKMSRPSKRITELRSLPPARGDSQSLPKQCEQPANSPSHAEPKEPEEREKPSMVWQLQNLVITLFEACWPTHQVAFLLTTLQNHTAFAHNSLRVPSMNLSSSGNQNHNMQDGGRNAAHAH